MRFQYISKDGLDLLAVSQIKMNVVTVHDVSSLDLRENGELSLDASTANLVAPAENLTSGSHFLCQLDEEGMVKTKLSWTSPSIHLLHYNSEFLVSVL